MVVLTPALGHPRRLHAERPGCRAVPRECRRTHAPCWLLDEALGEFPRSPRVRDARSSDELDNLVVVRCYGKGHALAGLRAGAALGPPGLVGGLVAQRRDLRPGRGRRWPGRS